MALPIHTIVGEIVRGSDAKRWVIRFKQNCSNETHVCCIAGYCFVQIFSSLSNVCWCNQAISMHCKWTTKYQHWETFNSFEHFTLGHYIVYHHHRRTVIDQYRLSWIKKRKKMNKTEKVGKHIVLKIVEQTVVCWNSVLIMR